MNETNGWQPIATYDALPEKKRRAINAVFYAAPTKAPAWRDPSEFLRAMVSVDRYFGSREITGWFEIPSLKSPPVQP